MATNPAIEGKTPDTVKLLINGSFVESKTTEWRDIVGNRRQSAVTDSDTSRGCSGAGRRHFVANAGTNRRSAHRYAAHAG